MELSGLSGGQAAILPDHPINRGLPLSEAVTFQLQILSQLTQLLHADTALGPRLNSFFTLLRQAIPYRDGRLTCWLQSARPGTQRQQYYSPDGWPYAWDDELTRTVALKGQFEVRTIVLQARASEGQRLPAQQVSYLGAPIFWGGRLWGVFELRGERVGSFDQQASEVISSLLPQLAAAIMTEGKRQHGEAIIPFDALVPVDISPTAQIQLARMSRDLEEPLTLPQLLARVLDAALEGSGAEAGAISLVEPQNGEIVLQEYRGYPPGWPGIELQPGQRQRWTWDVGLTGRAARSGRPLLVRDVAQEPEARNNGSGMRAELAAPIIIEGQAAAVITLDSPRSDAFGERELAFVTALCEKAAIPLKRALGYQAILEASTHLGQVFSSLPTGLALLDTSGKVVRANPSWSAIWGLKQSSPPNGFHVAIDLVEVLLPRLQEPLRLTDFCAENQRLPAKTQTLQVQLINPVQELQVLSVPTRDSQNQITGRLWAVSDVTKEREVDRLKNEFVSIVSHELRTPLTSILGYTELLLNREFKAEERQQFVKTVYDEAGRLSELVEDLLGVSRLEAGKVKLQQWVVFLRQLIAELTNQLNTALKQHRLLIRQDDTVPAVYIDRDKIKQVLHNLLTNAIKYSRPGTEIELAIRQARVRDLPADHPVGRWVIISVRDQGIGIAPEDLPRIWERFYRVDNTNTRQIGGTGLGLNITKALVELHGGRIWAESVVGEGSSFHFTVPVAKDPPGRLVG
jgi:signal transduction histidine kinase/putative methionine-R-sulfoxide reductase with GAF domain